MLCMTVHEAYFCVRNSAPDFWVHLWSSSQYAWLNVKFHINRRCECVSPTMFSEWQRLDPHSSTATSHCLLNKVTFASRRRNLHLQYRHFTGYASLFSDEPYLEKSVPRNQHFHRLLALFSIYRVAQKNIYTLLINIFGINLNEISISGWECNIMFSQQMAQALL